MSDYGSLLSIKRKNEQDLSEADRIKITAAVEKLKERGNFLDSLGQPFAFKKHDSPDEILYILSEYWHGDGDAEENFAFAEEGDAASLKDIETHVATAIGPDFAVTGSFEDW